MTTVLVLHAHLPWVVDTREERWLHEAVLDCYLPLLEVLEKLPDGAERLTLSVTPVLGAMLADEGARERTRAFLAEPRTGWHAENASRLSRAFDSGSLIERIKALGDRKAITLITSGITHGFLPLLMTVPEAARTQVLRGVESHTRMFGRAPTGFWLPECAYAPGLDALLAEAGIRYTFVDAHALNGSARGTAAPVFLPSGVAAFGRDPRASDQVWSAESGYPGDPLYADFHHRVKGERLLRVTGSEPKQPWDPSSAFARAREHAAHFLDQRARGEGVQVAPYDAELFGHWWLEGPAFLDAVLQGGAGELSTADEILRGAPTFELRDLPFSSWGRAGNATVWLGEHNGWMWPHLHRAAEEMFGSGRGNVAALQQLLLAQASDWPFLIDAKASAGFAREQFESHLLAFRALIDGKPWPAAPSPFPWLQSVSADRAGQLRFPAPRGAGAED